MKLIKSGVLGILLLVCVVAQSQKYGDVTAAEVAQMSHPEHPDAKAAFLVKNTDVWYDLTSDPIGLHVRKYHRIKIYDEDGLQEFADFATYLYESGSDKERLQNLKAQTHTMVDGEVVKQKLSKKDIFRGVESENSKFVKFAFPNVKAGSVIEVRYEVKSPFLYSTPKHYFQEDVPVSYSEFRIDVPEYISMAPLASGSIPLERKEGGGAVRNASRTVFTAKDVPPIADDDYVLNINDYRSSLKFEIESTQWPGQRLRNFSESWASIGKRLLDNDNFGKKLKEKVKLAKEFVAATKLLPQQERAAAVYDFVQQSVTWNRDYGLYASQNLNKTMSTGTGSVADINLLLTNLLRQVDVEAYPIATKPRRRGILNSLYPSLTELRYVIVIGVVGDKSIVMDASSKYFAMGDLPLRAINLEGLLVRAGGSDLVTIANTTSSKTKQITKLKLNTEDMSLDGTGMIDLRGYAATKARIKSNKEEEDEDNQNLEGGGDEDNEDEEEEEDEGIDLEEDVHNTLTTVGMEDISAGIKSEYECKLYDAVNAIGNEIFIDAFVINEFAENPFDAEERLYPAFFNTMHDHMYVAVIEKPEGFSVKSVPADLTLAMEGGKGTFIYAVTEDDSRLSIRSVLKVKDSTFLPKEYNVLRRFFDAVMRKQDEKIVFEKL